MIPRDFKAVPIVVICRDRLAPVRELLGWLRAAGYTRPILLDNASTYPPLLDFLATIDTEVVRLGSNMGHLAPWTSTELRELLNPDDPFVVTDCDVVPDEDCPADVVEHLAGVLLRYADVDKVGLGLRIDDLPDCYALKAQVVEWESLFWEHEIAPGIYEAEVDTTFALYRSPAERHSSARALRTGAPYRARHLPWYADSAKPTDEQRYYLAHADPSKVHWGADPGSENLRRLHEIRADDFATRQLVRDGANPMLDAWVGEPALADEQAFTPWASPGWPAWNGMTPELEFCEFAGALMRLIGPELTIETGIGQGFMTRRLALRLGPGQRLVSFEDDPAIRKQLEQLPFFTSPNHVLGVTPSPGADDFAHAELTILDSELPGRLDEFELWREAARPGSVLLVHDGGNGHGPETPHHLIRKRIEESELSGVFLQNPRGGFLAIQTGEATLRRELAHLEGQLAGLQSSRAYRLIGLKSRMLSSLRGAR